MAQGKDAPQTDTGRAVESSDLTDEGIFSVPDNKASANFRGTLFLGVTYKSGHEHSVPGEKPFYNTCAVTPFPHAGGTMSPPPAQTVNSNDRMSPRALPFWREVSRLADLQYEYVFATIVVKEQKLKLFFDNEQVDEFTYMLQ